MKKQKHCDCEIFKAERDKAIQRARDLQEGDEWNWMGTDEDDLESMSEGMVVRIRAEDLRGLLVSARLEVSKCLTQEAINKIRDEKGLPALPERCTEPGCNFGWISHQHPTKPAGVSMGAEPCPSCNADRRKPYLLGDTKWRTESVRDALKMCTYSGMKSFPVFDIPEKPEQTLTVGIDPGFEPATVTLKHIGSQFKISKEELDKAQEEMPSMVEKVQKLAMGGGTLGSVDHQPCRCDQMECGKPCEPCLTMAHGPISPPLPHHVLCTCDSDATDGVCQIHGKEDDGTGGK